MSKNLYRTLIFSGILSLLFFNTAFADPVTRSAIGAGVTDAVNQFRGDLGGVNNGVGGSFTSGRREINWDGVPNQFSEPNDFPATFFNVNSPRGVVFQALRSNEIIAFKVSASQASGTAVRFSNIAASYSTTFNAFSAEKIFHADRASVIEVSFFIPGTKIPATVSGFGAIFADVDNPSRTFIQYYAADGRLLTTTSVPAFSNNLSFAGTSFNEGERVARVVIQLGNAFLSNSNIDNNDSIDVVAMDDFIYGEPRAAEHHSGDFDGDGTTDMAVFRPSSGSWFVLNSGSLTLGGASFGLPGDIPIDGDFDGDGTTDMAVFRPSTGTWFLQHSSNSQFVITPFGINGDKPVAGDYDKDGKTDIAVWRPGSGDFFTIQSTTGNTTIQHWGQNGDIPIQGGAQ